MEITKVEGDNVNRYVDTIISNAFRQTNDHFNTASTTSYYNTQYQQPSLISTAHTSSMSGSIGSNLHQTGLTVITPSITSRIQEQIMSASVAPVPINETATCTVRVNGQDITGIWVNREECLNWRGPWPLERYRINTDAETTIIKKQTVHSHDATQNVSIKYLKPSYQAQVGDLIIRHEPDVQIPPAPPIIVRQQAAAAIKLPGQVIRERPPQPPPSVPQEVLTVPGRTIEPPARQVIVERLPQAAAIPGDIHIERWLGYGQQRRRIVHEKKLERAASFATPKNVMIDWEAQDRTLVRQKYNFLGVEQADPVAYERMHGHELVDSTRLPSFAHDLNVTSNLPHGEVLADRQHLQSREYILVGDVEALNLVEHDLTQYITSRF